MRLSTAAWLGVLSIGWSSLACSESKPQTSTDTAVDEAKSALAAAEPPPTTMRDAPMPKAGPPGEAYFAVEGHGIVELTLPTEEFKDGQFVPLKGSPKNKVRAMRISPAGDLWFRADDGIMKRSGDSFEVVAPVVFEEIGNVEDFAVSKDEKTIWSISHKGVAKFDGKKWHLTPREDLGAAVRFIKGVALDAQDRPWVVSSKGVHYFDGGAWKEAPLPEERRQFFNTATEYPGGVYLLASSQLFKVEGNDVKPVDLGFGRRLQQSELAVANNGIFALKSAKRELTRAHPGATATMFNALSGAVAADNVEQLAVDDRGRLWVATRAGVSVIGPGDDKVEWPSGSNALLLGRVSGIAVKGAGPSLPPPGVVKTGAVKGKIVVDGKPLANAAVELCTSPAIVFKTSPCEESAINRATNTSADGSFEVKNLPLGSYGIAAKTGDEWRMTSGTIVDLLEENKVETLKPVTLTKQK